MTHLVEGVERRPRLKVATIAALGVLGAITLGGVGVSLAAANQTNGDAPAAETTRVPTKEEAKAWVADAEARFGYKVGDPCPAPDENAPPLGDSPLMAMAGGTPCTIMYWVSTRTDLAAVTIDGDGNVRSMFTEPRGHVQDTPPTGKEN